MSHDISVMELTAILRIARASRNPSVMEALGRLVLLTKLAHAPEIAEVEAEMREEGELLERLLLKI